MVCIHQDGRRPQVSASSEYHHDVHIAHGYRRAGIPLEHESFKAFMREVFACPAISLFGFYVHAGNAYASTSLEEATSLLTGEVRLANDAAALALEVQAELGIKTADNQPFVLSVGSTPTAQCATAEAKLQMTSMLNGTLELHAGT
jgi:D-serine deaminase-like pyridoxal phosphate-dependent protein